MQQNKQTPPCGRLEIKMDTEGDILTTCQP